MKNKPQPHIWIPPRGTYVRVSKEKFFSKNPDETAVRISLGELEDGMLCCYADIFHDVCFERWPYWRPIPSKLIAKKTRGSK